VISLISTISPATPPAIALPCLPSLYDVRDPGKVLEFASRHIGLIPILIEAAHTLNRYFDHPALALSCGFFPDGDHADYGLWVDVKKGLSEECLRQAQVAFDFDWWYPMQYKHDAACYVNFAVSTLPTAALDT
jgi:hypothetical protein